MWTRIIITIEWISHPLLFKMLKIIRLVIKIIIPPQHQTEGRTSWAGMITSNNLITIIDNW